jgi:hypothetical protein
MIHYSFESEITHLFLVMNYLIIFHNFGLVGGEGLSRGERFIVERFFWILLILAFNPAFNPHHMWFFNSLISNCISKSLISQESNKILLK